ncbi:MAG: TraR/DksA C4-type zinc finger protein [Bacteroidetes bacterium]|nr:TraR/DksA C4-type zinc finger protein [Bacteroidota bacterium]
MDKDFVAEIRNEIIFRVHEVLNHRYGESVPMSLWDANAKKEDAFETIKRLESFKSDDNLIRLLEALRSTFTGDYGHCLSCGEQIELPKLLKNPLAKFCDKCEQVLSTKYTRQKPDDEFVQESQPSQTEEIFHQKKPSVHLRNSTE